MKLFRLLSPALVALLLAPPAWAQEEKPAEEKPAAEAKPAEEKPAEEKPAAEKPAADEKAEARIQVEVTPIVEGLTNPIGIALRPGAENEIYVSDSGALKVIKFDAKNPKETQDVVTGFLKDVYGKGPMYDIGPLGLAFLNENTLVVGGGGQEDGQELLRVYALPEDGKPIKADAMKASLGPIKPGEQSKKGEGNFYGLAIGNNAIYVTSNGDDTKGWVLKADVKEDALANLTTYIATKKATSVDAPVGVAFNPKKEGWIVIGQMGEISVPADSLLTFYSSKSGKMLLNLETGLNDIAALAYSPKGRLYALDFSWLDASKGALYRLDDDGKGGVEAVKVTDLDKPAGMAFAPDGTLYVTVFGSAEGGGTKGSGKVLKITGDL